ncbi:hydroxyethylthiazole kinase [Lactiplantibacillus mudanjiangensis]|uniref:Hydroxyethylthiazole kinase n=1 Tax=Lactiplantibacillus mudanjiangensis TaxID=1296538 RepID=A0A660DU05_9LACO|nr:hydroxyethylthiazole kinase [Lactiplantibacillus mudanjiangensis]VDG20992.1 hydroxyethylthiazole kinase [Lactobacillus pentosus] [Lactiplantibacillus mudanjiangensis]VDG22775.1 hydroxyethylthiazole kinase [Lactobacillus pentosus] [Lactiplantibacillus mudanjiangensis]VDG26656.1 hydroxyethylthiazole kinase [Lactobacillus pentosus] [Lactiplantibacillus mudanjiangensis]VDG31887.1 hydroxyethylthiazole kinase [Lactobacillus pentosus] [Lactiplantibacillus mudanjiangensis]
MKLDLLTTLRQQNPVVFNIANFVTVQDVANGLNAVGASPIMSAEVAEADQMIAIAGAVCLNLGTLTTTQVNQMQIVGRLANERQLPIVFDPVAVGAVPYRLQVAQDLLATIQMTVIRGNAGEIAALAGVDWQAKGIDAGNGSGDVVAIAKACAQKYHCVIVLSGPTDVITDGTQVAKVHNGTELFQLHVGSGDLLSSIVAAFTAVQSDAPFDAAQTACLVLAGTGELVAKQFTAPRPGTFAADLIDKLHLVTVSELTEVADYED